MEKGQSEHYSDSFDALLEALPPDAPVFIGIGGETWFPTSQALALAAYGNEAESRCFTDVSDSPHANKLNVLATYRLLNGTGDGAFRPKDVLTRAQLAAMIAQTFHVTAKPSDVFSDVKEDAWYADDVMVMHFTGMMDGYDDGTFRPDEPVTHAQMIAVMGRLGRFLNMGLYDVTMPTDARIDAFPEWAREGAGLMLYSQEFRADGAASILYDALENIDPNAPVLRGQAGATLYNLLVNIGVIRY